MNPALSHMRNYSLGRSQLSGQRRRPLSAQRNQFNFTCLPKVKSFVDGPHIPVGLLPDLRVRPSELWSADCGQSRALNAFPIGNASSASRGHPGRSGIVPAAGLGGFQSARQRRGCCGQDGRATLYRYPILHSRSFRKPVHLIPNDESTLAGLPGHHTPLTIDNKVEEP